MPGWSVVDIPMLVALPILLLASGFFSGSETALFGLSENNRMALRRGGTLAGRAVDALLVDRRMLLITILVGNMTVNVLYFVVTSVLLVKTTSGIAVGVLLAAGFLLLIIMFGEIGPKLVANAGRSTFASFIGPPLLTIHRIIGPLRLVLDRLVVAPLSRLTSPTHAPPMLDEQELSALLEVSSRRGVIDQEEQRVLQDVIGLSQRKVRDVMTPRVNIQALPVEASIQELREVAERTRLTNLPVFEGNIDHVIGLLPVKATLMDGAAGGPIRDRVRPVHYVPETARLDQLLGHFRESSTQLAMVVDEYGGTAGIVAVEDVVEELVGDIARTDEQEQEPPMLIGRGRWRVPGGISIHEWAEAFGHGLVSRDVATLGGLIVAKLGRAPVPGDTVELDNVRLEIEAVERARVVSVILTITGAAEGGEP